MRGRYCRKATLTTCCSQSLLVRASTARHDMMMDVHNYIAVDQYVNVYIYLCVGARA